MLFVVFNENKGKDLCLDRCGNLFLCDDHDDQPDAKAGKRRRDRSYLPAGSGSDFNQECNDERCETHVWVTRGTRDHDIIIRYAQGARKSQE